MHFVMKFIGVILQGNVSKTKQGLGEQDFSSFLANFFKYTITIMTLRVPALFLPYPLPKTISIKSLPTSIYLINYTINHIITLLIIFELLHQKHKLELHVVKSVVQS